jgi:hypothetical protein
MNHVRFHGAMHPGRALRQADSPYRRRPRNTNGTHPTDWIVLAMFLGTCLWLWWGPLSAWWDALMVML